MTEILTTGLKGLYNRINLFSSIQQQEVVDVTVHMNGVPDYTLASNRVMLTSRTESMMITGRDLSEQEFKNLLSHTGGHKITKKEYDEVKKLYHPEYNTGTNKIGEGVRKIGNTVMLTARADFHTKHGHDFMLHEYIQMLVNNSVMRADL